MKSPSKTPTARRRQAAASAALAALFATLPAIAEVNTAFDTDLGAFSTPGWQTGSAVWSSKFGGSMAVSNTTSWSWSTQLGVYGGNVELMAEMQACMVNGGVVEFDLIVDSSGVAVGDSVSPILAGSSGAGGGYDQEYNLPRITAAEVAGGPVTIRVSRLILPNAPYTDNDGELHFSSASDYFQFNLGRRDSNGPTTYYVDNFTIRANVVELPTVDPFEAVTIPFATTAEGFGSVSWEPTASSVFSSAFGGTMQASVPAASAEKSFWWVTNGGMSSGFAVKFNAAITGGGVLSYNLIAPTGTLAANTPYFFAKQEVGTFAFSQKGSVIDAADVVDIGGGFERVTVAFTLAEIPFALDNPYATLGFGIGREEIAPAYVFHIDNITLTPAQRSAAIAFNTGADDFVPVLDATAQTKVASTTAASATLTVDDAAGLSVGMVASGNPNVPAGATITAIAGLDVTLSAAATGTAAVDTVFYTAALNPTVAWSGTYGGTLSITSPGGPGESSLWITETDLLQNPTFNAAWNRALTQGGTLSYDLIADSGVLATLKPRIFTQQQSGAFTWVDNASSATLVAPGNIVALPSLREITRVTVPTSALAATLTDPYTVLGFGVAYTSASPVSFHLDNILVESSLPSGTASTATFTAGVQDFVPYLLGGVVHWTRLDVGAQGAADKAILLAGAPRGEQWLARSSFGPSAVGAEALALGEQLALAAANGGSLTFDLIVDDFSVTNPTVDFAAAGLGVKVGLQTVGEGDSFRQQNRALSGVTLPLASGASAVVPITIPLYAAGSSETDGLVLAGGTQFEIFIGSVCPETPVATADTTTTLGSAVVTVLSTVGLSAGLTVTGTGLPNATRVLSVDSATQLTLSAAATASGVASGAAYTRPVADRVDLIIDNLRVTANTAPVAPVISSAPSINLNGQAVAGRVLAAFATGATYAATGLPAGLSLDSATGILSGRPTANGTFEVTFTVTTAAGAASVVVNWTVTGAGTPNLVVTSFNVVGGVATLQWTGAAGNPVTVQRSTDLAGWSNLATGVTAETYTDPAAPTPRAFYRVIIP